MNASSIGAALRAERLRQGKGLNQITAETKITQRFLESLESERFDSLPGGAYKESFLRQYARALGLNEDESVAAFRQQFQEPPVALPPLPKPRPHGFLRGAGCVLLIVGGFMGLREVADSVYPDRKYAAPAISRNAPPQASREAIAPVADVAAAAPAQLPVHVAVSVTEPVWVSVSCDGAQRFTGTLVETDSRIFDASGTVTVLVGNAGGLTISLNGKPVGPIGARGEIQLVELTSKGARRLPRHQGAPAVNLTSH